VPIKKPAEKSFSAGCGFAEIIKTIPYRRLGRTIFEPLFAGFEETIELIIKFLSKIPELTSNKSRIPGEYKSGGRISLSTSQ
jgi:hypothetical protein